MNHGGELILTLLPYVIALLVAVAIFDELDLPPPFARRERKSPIAVRL